MIAPDVRAGAKPMLDIAFPEPEEEIYPCMCPECECQQKVAEDGKVCVLCSFGEHAEDQ